MTATLRFGEYLSVKRSLAVALVAVGLAGCGSKATLDDLASGVGHDIDDSSPSLATQTAKAIGSTLKKSAASTQAKSTMQNSLCTTISQYARTGVPPSTDQIAQNVTNSAASATLPTLPTPQALKLRNDAIGLLTDAQALVNNQHMSPRVAAVLLEGDIGCFTRDFSS